MGQELPGSLFGWRMVTNHIVSAVGIWFYAQSTSRYLYLVRNDPKHPDNWGLPGGKQEAGESLLQTLERECKEELGSMPEYIKLVPLEKFTSPDGGFEYHTFFCIVENEFTPVLNDEHNGYAWVGAGVNLRPIHPGLWSTINFDAVRSKIATIQQHYTSL